MISSGWQRNGSVDMWMVAMRARKDPLAAIPPDRVSLEAHHVGGGKVQRARQVHRFHRLSMDVATGRQQSASQHRVSGRQDLGRPVVPFSSYDTGDPEKLWKWMEAYEAKTGGRMLAIAHSGNLSNGLDVRRCHTDDAAAARPRLCGEPA